jgi:uncharacterized protein
VRPGLPPRERRWVDEGDGTLKQRILDYNEDDCQAMRVLLDGVRAFDVFPD